MSQNKNLMITVKKADGTFKKVLLSDLKKKKDDNTPLTPLKREKEDIDFDVVSQTRSSDNLDNKQSKKISVDRSAILDGYNSNVKVKKDDNALNSPNPSLKKEESSASISSHQQIKFTKRKIKKSNSSIVLPLRRGGAQRAEGLNKKDVNSLSLQNQYDLKKEKEVLKVPKLTSKDFKSPLEEDLPEIYHEPGKLTKSTPFNAFIHKKEDEILKQVQNDRVEVQNDNRLVQNNKKNVNKDKAVGLSSIVKQKVPMHDVIVKTKIYGPIEEIQNFSLVDLRRLSSDVGESVSRLQQKFTNIKEESIILYLKVIDTWIKSPLHKEYIQKISQSLSKGVSLEKILLDSKGINLTEIKALIIMNKTLEI